MATCGIRADRTLRCWGDNYTGQIGNGTTITQVRPQPVANGGTWASVVVDYGTTCGIKTDRTAWCWGTNYVGQLGDGTATNRSVPTLVGG